MAAAMLTAGEIQVLADLTPIWAALSGAVRDPVTGLYPIRLEDDPALAVSRYLQVVAVRRSLADGADTAVTTSQRGQEERWRRLADEAAAPFSVRTVDPGLAVVRDRLSDASGVLSDECRRAIERWYG